MIIGVLALQGDYSAHAKCLQALGATVQLVRQPEQLDLIAALIIPGGESSAFLKLLEHDNFFAKLLSFVHHKPTFGTCAGAILLARHVENPAQKCLGALDVSVRRNAYGSQRQSTIHMGETVLGGNPLEMIFIRAPRIVRIGLDVEVLAKCGDDPVWIRQGHLMAATFHPELSIDYRVHAEFLNGL